MDWKHIHILSTAPALHIYFFTFCSPIWPHTHTHAHQTYKMYRETFLGISLDKRKARARAVAYVETNINQFDTLATSFFLFFFVSLVCASVCRACRPSVCVCARVCLCHILMPLLNWIVYVCVYVCVTMTSIRRCRYMRAQINYTFNLRADKTITIFHFCRVKCVSSRHNKNGEWTT